MEALTLDEMFQNFDEKISNIAAKMALLHVYNENPEKCHELNGDLGTIQFIFHDMNRILEQAEIDYQNQTERCLCQIQLLDDQLDYMEKNYPKGSKPETEKGLERNETFTVLNKQGKKPNNRPTVNQRAKKSVPVKKEQPSVPIATDSKETNVSTAVPVSSATYVFPEMKSITMEEYDSIPKYMLSRLSIETLNDSVSAFNVTIRAKYTFLKKFDVQNTKEADYKRYQGYKAQENADTKGVHFATINDIKELSAMKNDATLRKVLICLRHLKRIREIRGGNQPKLIRYGLVVA